eukprot:379484-Rhodomonas_salina.1
MDTVVRWLCSYANLVPSTSTDTGGIIGCTWILYHHGNYQFYVYQTILSSTKVGVLRERASRTNRGGMLVPGEGSLGSGQDQHPGTNPYAYHTPCPVLTAVLSAYALGMMSSALRSVRVQTRTMLRGVVPTEQY